MRDSLPSARQHHLLCAAAEAACWAGIPQRGRVAGLQGGGAAPLFALRCLRSPQIENSEGDAASSRAPGKLRGRSRLRVARSSGRLPRAAGKEQSCAACLEELQGCTAGPFPLLVGTREPGASFW